MSHTVTRRDFVKRSCVTLKCDTCGTTTTYCAIDDADIYESGYAEHVCSFRDGIGNRPALRRLLRFVSGVKS